MQRSIESSYKSLAGLEGVLSEAGQSHRRQQEAPSAGDALTARRAPLPLRGNDLNGRRWHGR